MSKEVKVRGDATLAVMNALKSENFDPKLSVDEALASLNFATAHFSALVGLQQGQEEFEALMLQQLHLLLRSITVVLPLVQQGLGVKIPEGMQEYVANWADEELAKLKPPVAPEGSLPN